jgi:hypothetical protein
MPIGTSPRQVALVSVTVTQASDIIGRLAL